MNPSFPNSSDSFSDASFHQNQRDRKRSRGFSENLLWGGTLCALLGYSLWHFGLLPVQFGFSPSGHVSADHNAQHHNSDHNPENANIVFDLNQPAYEPAANKMVFNQQSEPTQTEPNAFPTDNKLQTLTADQSTDHATASRNNPFAQATTQVKKVNHQVASSTVRNTVRDSQVQTLSYNADRNHVKVIQQPYRANPANSSTLTIQPVSNSQRLPSKDNTSSNNQQPIVTSPSVQNSSASKKELPLLTPTEEIQKHRKLSQIYWSKPEQRATIRPELQKLSRKIYFSPHTDYIKSYTVQPGEQLRNIAKKYDVPWQYLARLNRVTPEKIRAGQTLKVIRGPFHAVVDKSGYHMTIHAHGYYVAEFPVGLGKENSTPAGKFVVKNKEVNPVYYGPDGVIDRDDPKNPLGERWIDLGNHYGIHGTIDAKSIGQSQSRGCVRMHNLDVAVLFDLLTVGSEVTIRP